MHVAGAEVDYAVNDRQMGTLMFQGKNVAAHLIGQGFAKVTKTALEIILR